MGETIEIKTSHPLSAYLAKPTGEAKGAVIVIHEVWGLVDQIRSVADRLASEGYIALAPDFITDTLEAASVDTSKIPELQESLFDPERRNQVQPELRKLMAPIQNPDFSKQTTAGLRDCFVYLYDLPESCQKVSVMGFCFGGSYSFNLAMEEPRLAIALPFYGHCDAEIAELENIHCPVRAFYGEQDERLISGLDELEQKMSSAGVDFITKIYPNCGHAFFNDTNRFAYNQEAANDAWELALEYLKNASA